MTPLLAHTFTVLLNVVCRPCPSSSAMPPWAKLCLASTCGCTEPSSSALGCEKIAWYAAQGGAAPGGAKCGGACKDLETHADMEWPHRQELYDRPQGKIRLWEENGRGAYHGDRPVERLQLLPHHSLQRLKCVALRSSPNPPPTPRASAIRCRVRCEWYGGEVRSACAPSARTHHATLNLKHSAAPMSDRPTHGMGAHPFDDMIAHHHAQRAQGITSILHRHQHLGHHLGHLLVGEGEDG